MTNFIFYVNPEVTLVCRSSTTPGTVSLVDAASLTGVPLEMLRYYTLAGLISFELAAPDHEPRFDREALEEIRSIETYRRRDRIPLKSLPFVCGLQREIDRLNGEIDRLRREIDRLKRP